MKDQDVTQTACEALQKNQLSPPPSLPLPSQCVQIRVPALTPKPSTHKKIRRRHILKPVDHNNTPLLLPSTSPPSEDLAPTRVQRLHLKKPQDKLQEMVELQGKTAEPLSQKRVKSAHTNQQKTDSSSSDQLWYDLAKAQEERLFQIDRTIK